MKKLLIFSLLLGSGLINASGNQTPDGSFSFRDITVKVFKNADGKTGRLDGGQEVKLVCIKRGMIGMPNISGPGYIGSYTSTVTGEKCYVFSKE